MTDQPHQIRYARRFVIRQPEQPDIHGVALPSGKAIYDQPSIGIEVALTTNDIRTATLDNTLADTPDAVIHWADEEPPDEPVAS